MTTDVRDIKRVIREIYPSIRALRRDLHRHPEIGYEEVRTAKKVSEHLRKLKIPHKRKVGKTGVVGLVRGTRSGKCIALRADMDALAMQEKNRFAHRSVYDGRMHACGHDGHTANLVGVAHVLSRLREHVRGSVKLLFQPSEEGGAGAAAMMEDGALEHPKPDVIYGLHQTPLIPLGKIGYRSGPMCASTASVDVVFHGRGAHAARPHQAIDPIMMASTFVQTVQTIVSRRVDPLERAVLTFGTCHSGTARNVIPDEARLTGTVRAYKRKLQNLILRELRRIARNVARAMGGTAEIEIEAGYPPVINDNKATAFLKSVAIETVGKGNVVEAEPTMGGEDFAFFLEEVPGAFFRLGNGRPERPAHSPTFDFDDRALQTGMLVLSLLAIRWLEEH